MTRLIPLDKWHNRFLNLAEEVKTWSKDPKCQVGCVIISPDKKKISYGFNGFPSGISDNDRLRSDDKNDFMIHAELNAILNAKANIDGWSLYCTKTPCCNCALTIIQSGIKEVFVIEEMTESQSWKTSQTKARALFNEANIKLTIIERGK